MLIYANPTARSTGHTAEHIRAHKVSIGQKYCADINDITRK